MTATKVLQALKEAGKPVSRMQLYRYLDRFKIKPLGIRQRPQQYPVDADLRILYGLGIYGSKGVKTNGQLVSTQRLTATAHKARRKK